MNATKNYIVIDRDAARALTRRTRRLENLVVEVRRTHLADRTLLNAALAELAAARNAKDSGLFARRWLQAHRTIDNNGLTIVHQAPLPTKGS